MDLNKEAKLFSLEQRREKQLFILMYKLSKRGVARQITNRNTRIQQKYVFKTDVKIGKKYEKSPYHNRTQMWDKLTRERQFAENIIEFKKKISTLYKNYKDMV